MGVLTESIVERIKALLPRYPSKQAVTLPALHMTQDELRCVPLEAIREIADLLDLSPAEVHDTMSFYGIFRDEQHKLGAKRLWVCRGLACALMGGAMRASAMLHSLSPNSWRRRHVRQPQRNPCTCPKAYARP